MLIDQLPPTTSFQETEIDNELSAVEQIIIFLDTYLPNFPSIFKRKFCSEESADENLITQELIYFLEDSRESNKIPLFRFHHQLYEYRRSSDIGIINVKAYDCWSPERTKAFFLIEAKRLPSPGRKKEYVSGNSGGIERYKKEHHGKGLDGSAMVGYVQKHNCGYWHGEINKWINELIATNTAIDIRWDSDDLLTLEADFNTAQKYTSQHSRIGKAKTPPIRLHHYLIDLT